MVDRGGQVIIPPEEVLEVQHQHGCKDDKESEEDKGENGEMEVRVTSNKMAKMKRY